MVDYLKNSQVNRFIYKQMLVLLPDHQIEIPLLTLLNEIYYQCVRVQYDGTPGEDISRRYLDEEEAWLGPDSGHANILVFCYVYVLVSRKAHPSFEEECFLKRLFPLIDGCEFISAATELMQFMKDNGISSPYKFKARPCPLKEIPMRIDLEYRTSMTVGEKLRKTLSMPVESSPIDFNPWRKVTDNFSPKAIVFYVRLYNKREDQMRLVERIELACTKAEHKSREEFFTKLRMSIRSGGYVNNSLGYTQDMRDYIYGFTGEWRNNADVKRLRTENYELQQHIDELQSTIEVERSRMEAKYQAEIAELKQRFNESAPQIVSDEDIHKSKPAELTMTISELTDYVKERFSKTGGDEVCTMLYHIAVEHGNVDEETFKLIDSIGPAILKRDQSFTKIEIPTAGQVNINPQNVHNHKDS